MNVPSLGASVVFAWNVSGHSGDLTKHFFEGFPKHASTRLQVLPAIRATCSLGYSPSIYSLAGNDSHFFSQEGSIAACVISKLTSNILQDQKIIARNTLAMAALMLARGIPLILLYCDHHAQSPSLVGDLYRDLLKLANIIVCPCHSMAQSVKDFIGRNSQIFVVEDSCLVSRQSFPALNSVEPCKLLWFGNAGNAKYLMRELPGISAKCNAHASFELTILGDRQTTEKLSLFCNSLRPIKPWSFRFICWDRLDQPAQLNRALGPAHLTLIPSDRKNIWKVGVSHNRLVDSIQGGCIAIASPMQSYQELSRISLVGENFPLMINSSISQYDRLSRKYDALRDAQLSRFMPDQIEDGWRKLLHQI